MLAGTPSALVIIVTMKFNIPSHTIAVLETLANVVDIRVDRSLTDSYFVPRDYTPPSTLVELSFPPPPIRDGKVSEHDLYEWLPLVARALEKEEARIACVPSIAVLYEQEDCQESLQALYSRDGAPGEESPSSDLAGPSHPVAEEGPAGTGPIVEWNDSEDDLAPLSRWDWEALKQGATRSNVGPSRLHQ